MKRKNIRNGEIFSKHTFEYSLSLKYKGFKPNINYVSKNGSFLRTNLPDILSISFAFKHF